MTEESTQPKDDERIKFKSVRLPVKTYVIRIGYQVEDEEAAKEAWRLMVKASGFSVITDPVLRVDQDIWRDQSFTVIEGTVVEHPNIPGPRPLRNPNYLDLYILEERR